MVFRVRTTAADYHFHAYGYPNDDAAVEYALSPADPQRHNLPFYSLRRDLASLVADGIANNVPNLALIQVGAQIGADNQTYHTLALRFGDMSPGAPKVLLTGGIHAREWIAPEVTYLIAEYLLKNFSQHPAGDCQTQLSELVNNRNITIIPMLNPGGNWFSTMSAGGQTNWRKNRRLLPDNLAAWANELNHPPFANVATDPEAGTVSYDVPQLSGQPARTVTFNVAPVPRGVDCNRNFNTPGWGSETDTAQGQNMQQGNPNQGVYFGPDRSSETETANLTGLFAGLGDVAASIDYHSYSRLIIVSSEAAISNRYRRLGQALQELITVNGSEQYALGDALQTVGYRAVSSVMDYMALTHRSSAFTVELDPGPNAGAGGFMLREDQIKQVFEKNIRGALALIATANNNPRSFWRGLFCCCSSPWAESVRQFDDWDVADHGNQLP